MNKRRLLKLADLLEADAKNKRGLQFNLSEWGTSLDYGSPASISCGTTACAMGLAVLSGAFKRAGLSNFFPKGSSGVSPVFRKGRKIYAGFEAAVALFDISHDDSCGWWWAGSPSGPFCAQRSSPPKARICSRLM